MKKFSTYISTLLATCFITICTPGYSQMVGDQIFLQGKFVEVGVAPNGALGSTRLPPTGFHCRSPYFNFYDPGTAAFTGSSNQRLMMVYDAGHDGWTTGTPGFFGDYSMPGTPYEGWGIQVNGAHSEAQAQYYLSTTTGFAGGASLTGTNVSYSNPLGQMVGVWQGTAAAGGALSITQTTVLDTLASWVKMTVKIKNTSASTVPAVYYLRETDPDNDQTAAGGSFVTTNVINHQNDYYHRVMVTATGTFYTTQTLSLSTKDCRAKCFIQSGWPMSTTLNLATLWATGGSGLTFSGTVTADVAIGLVYNLGDIAAGDSTVLSYAYVFNGLLGIDSAIANPQLVVNGIARDTTDTVTSCSFTGSSLACSIINGSTADWFGSTWTWAPSTYLSATTGLTNTVAVSSITTPITYTITGTTGVTGCSGRTFLLTVMPPGTTPPPTTTSTLSYCLGATAAPLSASGIGTIYWWTTPTGGTGTTTAPTPSTTAVGTTTYYVSQLVAGCPSDRIPINVTVFALSTPITGSLFVCTGFTTTLANATTGGTWSSGSTGIATVGASTGVVTGVSPGTSMISYSVLGCLATVVVTVTTTPAPITGIMIACLGSTTTLADAVGGGSWSSSNIFVATVGSSTGIVTGASLGTATITYNMGGGCYITTIITVNPLPAAITGAGSVCVGATTPLASATPGGLWTSSTPAVASVGVVTGIVTGSSAGTATISYRVSGCSVTFVMTVVTAATPIIGPTTVCVGSTVALSNASPGGTWVSGSTGIATIGLTTGIATGISIGTTDITYSLSAGCNTSRVLTVVAAPAAVTGSLSLCLGSTGTLLHPVTGGTWSAGTGTGTITVGLGTGSVTGTGAGTSTVTYTLPSGCISVGIVTVNPLPGAITGTLGICQGATTTLSSSTPTGTWSSLSPGVASVGSSSGIVTGLTGGTSTIVFTASTGCTASAVVTVNLAPSAITGTTSVCVGQTTPLFNATAGGAWSSSTAAVGTISGTGVVTGISAGSTTITYALGSGCYTTTIVTVNAGPAALTGSLGLCVGFTTTLASTTPGGVWTSSAPLIATILSPGFIGGSAPGTAIISYTVGSCSATAVVTVNAIPGAIGGPTGVCIGQTITLTNPTSGGTWSCTLTGGPTASINVTTGVLTGLAAGTSTVTYSLGSGCIVTTVVTINSAPAPITGTLSLCAGNSTTLTSATSGGTWLSSDITVATIGVGTGIVSTLPAGGTTTITYTLPSTCRATAVLTVNIVPAVITGSTSICSGQCTTMSDATPGGAWSSTAPSIGTINAVSGLFCGNLAGTSTVSYTMPSGCARTIVMLVNPIPTAISGSLQVCAGSTSSLSGSPSGGTWSSSTPAIGTIGIGSGTLGGIASGTTTITYTVPSTCYLTAVATVNPLPAAITGVMTVCVGQTTPLATTSTGGTWSSSPTTIATVSSTGVVSGSTGGTAIITYTAATGCRTTTVVTVFALPGVVTGAGNVCPGTTTTLNCLPAGGTWTTSSVTVATVGLTTGVVTGGTPGTATILYTLGTGCTASRIVTVNNLPNPITGTMATCVGQTTTLSSTTTGGTWTTGSSSIATVDISTGVVTGVSGTATTLITYTATTGCIATATVTVYGLPGAITGNLQVCTGLTSTLSTSTPGGTWVSSTPSMATIDISTGVVTGISPVYGTTTITYSLGTGCYKTAVVSVNPLPAPVTGTTQVCIGSSTTLSCATSGGVWSSGSTAIATVGATTGVVNGISTGTVAISYTMPSTCSSVAIVTVNSLPSVISGPSVVCENATITLGSLPSGGTWSSSSTFNAVVDMFSGLVTGMNSGTTTISYTAGIGCTRTKTVSVNAQPAAITGNLGVCIGTSSLLSTISTGGTWSSSIPAVATIDATGLVNSVTVGNTNIVYTLPFTGCTRTVEVSVNPLPGPIMGSDGFCNLSSTTYTSLPSGGVIWSSSNTSVITINPTTGVATGVSVDTAYIIATNGTGCTRSKKVFLILAPYPISGPDDVCLGQTATLSNVIGGGVWTTSNPGVLPISTTSSTTASVTGLAVGTSNVSYSLSTGCASGHAMTVNPIPTPTSGTQQVCQGLTITLSNSTLGGNWESINPSVATVGSTSGIVTAILTGSTVADTTTIMYRLGSGCNAPVIVTVNPLPNVITGSPQMCEGLTTTLVSGPAGGTWSSANPPVASVDAITGIVTGISAMTPGVGGLGQTTITYTLPTTCIRTEDVTVNPLPNSISGVVDICIGDVTLLTNSTPGGGWISSNTSVATVDATGIVTGITAGSVVISYILPTSCIATHPMTVNANPAPITGSLGVCAGFSTNLSSGPAGGSWSQDPSSMIYGTIHSITGVVSGVLAGTIPITYTLGSGCRVYETVTVITLPGVIGGTPQVCVGGNTTMTNPVAGGTWSSSVPSVGTIDAITGVVGGISAGTAVVTYHVGTGCFNVHTITVNPLPGAITGPLQVCEGSTILLSSTTSGGIWISDATATATVGYLSGVVSGISAGLANITYTLPATGCLQKVQVTVNTTPYPIIGNPHICIGSSNTFIDTMPGGIWVSGNTSILTIGATTGIATSVSLGSVTISYVLPATGCMATRVVSVQPLPIVYNVTGGGNYCSGGTGVHVGLSNSQPGVSYVLYNGSSAMGYISGTGFPLDFGLMTASGTYSVRATNATSLCDKNMAGSVVVNLIPLVTPSLTIATTPSDSVCPGQSINMTAIPVNGGTTPTYLWKVNGVTVTTANSYAFIPADGDIATVTMTSNASCLSAPTATAVKTLTVLPNALPIAGVITSPDDSVCQFNPVTFTANPTYGGPTPTYTWFVNGVTSGTGTSYSYVPVDGDVVTMTMASNYQCRLANSVNSAAVVMSVDSLLVPHVAVWPDPGFVVEAGKPVTLHATVTDGGINPSYQWKVNGTSIPGATLNVYTAIFNDYDSISCQVISSGVCNNIGTHDWVFITVYPESVTPTAGLVSDIRLVPNPNKGAFTIKGTLASGISEDVNAEVTDMLGQVVYRGLIKTNQGKLDSRIQINNMLANGMYILTLRTENEQKVFHFVMEQ